MATFYFVGGPKAGRAEEFFRRLNEVGGAPSRWRIYPYASNDGRALHIAEVESPDEILDHLRQFDDIYEHSEIVEIVDARARQPGQSREAAS